MEAAAPPEIAPRSLGAYADEISVSSTSSSSQHEDSKDGNADNRALLVRSETVAVQCSKVIVYMVLLLAATAVGAATYYLLASEQYKEFVNEFAAISEEIIHATQSNEHSIMGLTKGLSTMITSIADVANYTWPLVTIPHFDYHASHTMEYSGGEMVFLAPIVRGEDEEAAWNEYSRANQGWIRQDLEDRGWSHIDPGNISGIYPWSSSLHRQMHSAQDSLHQWADSQYEARSNSSTYNHVHVPIWQSAPVPVNASRVNLDLMTYPTFKRLVENVLESHSSIRHEHARLSQVVDLRPILNNLAKEDNSNVNEPHSFLLQPVLNGFAGHTEGFDGATDLVAFVVAVLDWRSYFNDILPEGQNGLVVFMSDTCGSKFTYVINGHDAQFMGYGDLHNVDYGELHHSFDFSKLPHLDDEKETLYCNYVLTTHPSKEFEATYYTSAPAIYTGVVVLVFFGTAITFLLYDCMVQRRQEKVLGLAKRTQKVLGSLFPKTVQERIMKEAEAQAEQEKKDKRATSFFSAKHELENFLDHGSHEDAEESDDPLEHHVFKTKPIADFFPEATVLFADLVGFTAWSSAREPSQVFVLLEIIYHSFDEIAKRRRVFKVETVGDCYVAVAGVPNYRSDHAVAMARFARDCLYKLESLSKKLEVMLGPDTHELGMRFGMHSGPVTAGVLRGDNCRFQLFGDTMNTTARIEASGAKNKMHISSDTARLLVEAGKEHWVCPREGKVNAKGKGELQTFWLQMPRAGATHSHSRTSGSTTDSRTASVTDVENRGILDSNGSADDRTARALSDKEARLIEWVKEILLSFLKQIALRRKVTGAIPMADVDMDKIEERHACRRGTVLEEVKEVICLPRFDASTAPSHAHMIDGLVSETVQEQVGRYVVTICAMYRENPFHSFEHCGHVAMSVVKLLSRIIAPDLDSISDDEKCNLASTLHDHTYGITSDPLTQFAVVFSAVIHDADHPGVPNAQLVKEKTSMAQAYKNKSVAEQNSVEIAWDLLMDSDYRELRRAIYCTEDEFLRFRQLVSNTVMATDIADKELNALRKERWNKAFSQELNEDNSNRRATIVIEHLIQASDIAHTMQHWHIYRKWNRKLFHEQMKAWREGRAESNPADSWYKGEMGFFDFYIIPLANKLKDCGVFGVSSDEYLNYAMRNRQEWEREGRRIVEEMLEDDAEMNP